MDQLMTAHRNLKAAIRRFMSAHDVSYTEARRLMGLDVLTLEFTDEQGLEVAARIEQNDLEVRWCSPAGDEDLRSTHLSNLLGAGIWTDAYNPAFKADGRMEGYGATFLAAEHVERIRDWARTHVKAPTVLSVRNQEFIEDISVPWDQLYTVIDRQLLQAHVYVVRLPAAGPTSSFPLDVFAWQDARHELADELFEGALDPAVDLTDCERYHQIVSGGRAGSSLEDAIRQHREHAVRELARRLVPEATQLSWSASEVPLAGA
jgi:hypothetical protein